MKEKERICCLGWGQLGLWQHWERQEQMHRLVRKSSHVLGCPLEHHGGGGWEEVSSKVNVFHEQHLSPSTRDCDFPEQLFQQQTVTATVQAGTLLQVIHPVLLINAAWLIEVTSIDPKARFPQGCSGSSVQCHMLEKYTKIYKYPYRMINYQCKNVNN